MGPSSSSAGPARRRRKDQPSSKINKRTLLYKKSLTHDDVSFCRLMIPLESGRKFLPEPKKYNGVYLKIFELEPPMSFSFTMFPIGNTT
ncbi:hypothetical protein CK203_062475 [Vitis vinifera]|uniref:Uncharacterized protein n=1 Tax=Vitis vinifera TaxID=29760 RepID=A0A438FUF2_VITVI|nr:hypothetical protein CK203_062475 [Vitis vinifera]